MLEAEKVEKAFVALENISKPYLTMKQLCRQYFDIMENSGLRPKAIYEYLVKQGVDLGNYPYFYQSYYRVRQERRELQELQLSQLEMSEKQSETREENATQEYR